MVKDARKKVERIQAERVHAAVHRQPEVRLAELQVVDQLLARRMSITQFTRQGWIGATAGLDE